MLFVQFPKHGLWKSLAVVAIVFAIAWEWGALPVCATLVTTHEFPDVTLVRSRRALQDVDARSWQVIAFKRVRDSSSDPLLLRLVGYPEGIAFDRDRPLLADLEPGPLVSVPQHMGRLTPDIAALPNVGQFNISELANDLPGDRSLRITLPLASGIDVVLKIPPYLQREWRTVADFHV